MLVVSKPISKEELEVFSEEITEMNAQIAQQQEDILSSETRAFAAANALADEMREEAERRVEEAKEISEAQETEEEINNTRRMISEYGKDAFEAEFVSKHRDEELAHAAAVKYIRRHIFDNKCLNRKFQREDGLTYEEQQEIHLMEANEAKKKNEASKRRSDAQKKAWEKRRKKQQEKA